MWSIGENIKCRTDLWRNEGLVYPSDLSQTAVFHCTFDHIKPSWEKEIIITHILPFFVVCSNSFPRNLDRGSLSFGSWHYRSWNRLDMISPGNQQALSPVARLAWLGISHWKWVFTTYYFIHYVGCYLSSNSDCFLLSSLGILCCLLRIHLLVKDRYWPKHPTSLSVLNDHWAGILPARKLTYWLNQAGVIRCLRLKHRRNLHNATMT